MAHGQHQEAIDKLSHVLIESIFHQYQAIATLVDGWIALDENDKACEALEWIYGVMDSLKYNSTTMMLIQIQLAGLYDECGKHDLMKNAIRKAAELVKENTLQEFNAAAEFLKVDKAREMIISAPQNKELLMNVAASMGSDAIEIVNEVLL